MSPQLNWDEQLGCQNLVFCCFLRGFLVLATAIACTILQSSAVFFCQVFCQAPIDVTSRQLPSARLLGVLNSEMAIPGSYSGKSARRKVDREGTGKGMYFDTVFRVTTMSRWG